MRKRLGEILLEHEAVTSTGLEYALIRQEQWGHRIGRCLLDMRQCSEEDIVRALSVQLGLAAVCVGDRHIPETLSCLIPSRVAHELRAIPIALLPSEPHATLRMAMTHPWDTTALETLRRITEYRIVALICGDLDMAGALLRIYGPRKEPAIPDPPATLIEEQPAAADDVTTPVPAWDDLTLERNRK